MQNLRRLYLKNRKNLLFISYYFPPLGGGGVQRMLKFVKYLDKEKYNIHILTVDAKFIKYTKDPSLYKDIPNEISVHHVSIPDMNWLFAILGKLHLGFISRILKNFLFLPDEKIVFFLFSRSLLRKIIMENQIDTVILSLPPFGLYKFAPYIKRKYKIPIITDIRDLWTDNFSMIYEHFPVFKFIRETKYEKRLIENSDFIVTATEYIKNTLMKKYKINNIETITNGYDPDDFIDYAKGRKTNKNKLCFAYIGSLYGHQNPENLFKAIKRFKNDKFTFDLYGFVEKGILSRLLSDIKSVRHYGYVPHSSLLRIYEKSDILLLYIGGYDKKKRGILTGKLFEYLYTRKPILFIGPTDGEAAGIIRKCNAGFIVEDNVDSIYKTIIDIHKRWENGKLKMKFNNKEITKYNRELLTRHLERIIDKV